ncbi:unnamed protein product [Ixodes pacificus]
MTYATQTAPKFEKESFRTRGTRFVRTPAVLHYFKPSCFSSLACVCKYVLSNISCKSRYRLMAATMEVTFILP